MDRRKQKQQALAATNRLLLKRSALRIRFKLSAIQTYAFEDLLDFFDKTNMVNTLRKLLLAQAMEPIQSARAMLSSNDRLPA